MATEVTAGVVRPSIKIGGTDLDDELDGHVGEIEVENCLHLPDVATVRFQLNDVGYDDIHTIPDDKFKNLFTPQRQSTVRPCRPSGSCEPGGLSLFLS